MKKRIIIEKQTDGTVSLFYDECGLPGDEALGLLEFALLDVRMKIMHSIHAQKEKEKEKE